MLKWQADHCILQFGGVNVVINVYNEIIYDAVVSSETAVFAKSQLPLILIMLAVNLYNEGNSSITKTVFKE